MNIKCTDCNKEFDIHELLQIKGNYEVGKYRLVCEDCFKKHKEYEYTGRFKD